MVTENNLNINNEFRINTGDSNAINNVSGQELLNEGRNTATRNRSRRPAGERVQSSIEHPGAVVTPPAPSVTTAANSRATYNRVVGQNNTRSESAPGATVANPQNQGPINAESSINSRPNSR